ncbi:MAG TPA: bifunctional 2-polyprenyl-6-hydroxyphenol methylase/3-demethylubiquinol 3-O-methyltransferase UbiG [Beijerinckiaceae bacterium]
MSDRAARASVDLREVEQFERLGARWWSETGPMRPLHRLNPVRVRWMRDAMIDHFAAPDGGARDPDSLASLEGLRVLDVGCGGGLLCEPFARLGAQVTGIDPAPGNVDIARAHAQAGGLDIDYRAVTVEELAAQDPRFDVVCAMEVVEHVVDPAAFVRQACALVKPGGLFFASTLNRTLKSFALAIVGAEYVLRWVPPGTHRWEKFVTPAELEDWIVAGGLEVTAFAGVSYNPLRDAWDTSRDLDVNYMLVARRLMRMA